MVVRSISESVIVPGTKSRVGGRLVPVPVCPFSVTTGFAAVPPRSGASLSGLTVVPSATAFDHGPVVPRVAERSALAAKLTGASEARTVRPPGVPLKSAAGTKRSRAVGARSRASPSLRSERMVVQSVPFSEYCHSPWAASAVLPVMEMPPNGVAALPPPEIALRLSVASE